MVKIFVKIHHSKIDLAEIYFHTKLTFSETSTQKVLYDTFLECCNPRFLNKTEIATQKYNDQEVIYTLPVVKTKDMSTNQTRNHFLLVPEIIVKPHFCLFLLLSHLPLWFKSMHSCSTQYIFYYVKANVIHSHCYN